MKKLLILLLCCASFLPISAQVKILPQQVSGQYYGLDQLKKLILLNTAEQSMSVMLRYSIKRDGKIQAIVESNSVEISNGNNRLDDKLDLEITEYSDQVFESYYVSSGYFFPGSYEICIDIVGARSVELLDKTCYGVQIGRSLNLWLSLPYNKAEIEELNSWNWMPISGFDPASIRYSFKLVELGSGQTAEEAIVSNLAHIQADGLVSTILNNQSTFKPLEISRTYVWQVIGYYKGIELARSEVWTFNMVRPNNEVASLSGIIPVAKHGSIPEFNIQNDQLNFRPEDRLVDDYSLKIVDTESNKNIAKSDNVLSNRGTYLNVDLKKAIGRAKDKEYLIVLTDRNLDKSYYLMLIY